MPTYWIDKHGGSHYHRQDCPMVKEPHYHYEQIFRKKARKPTSYSLQLIRESGRYYFPCPGCFANELSRF